MAWPLTPLTTYVPSSTPAIKASDLDSFQSGINGIVSANYTLAGLAIDGTGGALITAQPSHINVSGASPSLSAGPGAGTGPSLAIAVDSCDTHGFITVTTGSTPTSASIVVTVNLVGAYLNTFSAHLFPINAAAAGVATNLYIPQALISTAFTINCVSSLAGATAYKWQYLLIGF